MALNVNFRIDEAKVASVSQRVMDLADANRSYASDRERVRNIMDGGSKAIAALLGNTSIGDGMPVANMMLTASTRLAQKLGRAPDIKKDPPFASDDKEIAHKRAERLARIVESHDEVSKLQMQLPQAARWLPGYGFVAWVVEQGYSRGGDPFPKAELRDPWNTYPGNWGVAQQPDDIAFAYITPISWLVEKFPEHRAALLKGYGRVQNGAVLLDPVVNSGEQGWANQSGRGIEVYEYMNNEGTWWVVPDRKLLLSFTPNVLDRSCFYVMKRFAFNRLVGQYDHVIGLMAAMARLNLLLIIATEDSVLAETNIVGSLEGPKYRRGRNAINFFAPGTQVEKMNSRIPFEAFQYMSNLERQLRGTAGYSVQDDGVSPNSFATGRGLQELTASIDLEVREYQTVIADGLIELDAIRLEWDDKLYKDETKTMAGVRSGAPFSEKYTPSKHINGDYVTRRVYGAMAGFDDATKVLTGLQLLQADIIDDQTMMENIDGLENHSKIRERIRAKKAEKVVEDVLLARAGEGDMRALEAAIGMLPESKYRTLLEDVFLSEPEEPEVPEEELAMPGAGVPEDVGTVLARLTSGESGVNPTLSSQTVGRVA